MQIVNPAPEILTAPPSGPNSQHWVSLLRNLFGIFSSHANAINLLWENIEDDTEYLIPNRTFEGNPIYFQRFAAFLGVNGTGAPASATKAHGITGLQIHKWLVMNGGIIEPLAVSLRPFQMSSNAAAIHDNVFVNATNIVWRVDYNATFTACQAYMEYQKA